MASSVPKIEEVVLEKGSIGLGFNIRGGTDNVHVGSDPGIFVTTVRPVGAAAKDGRLAPGDKILEINGNDLREVSHQTAVNNFHAAGDTVQLLVERGAEARIRSQRSASSPIPLSEEEPSEQPAKSSEILAPLEPPAPPEESRLAAIGNRPWVWIPLLGVGVGVGISIIAIIWYIRRSKGLPLRPNVLNRVIGRSSPDSVSRATAKAMSQAAPPRRT